MGNEKNWILNVYDVPGRKIVMTEGIGQANAEDVKKVTETVLSKGKKFGSKWAYIPMIEKMNPIFDPETQQEPPYIVFFVLSAP